MNFLSLLTARCHVRRAPRYLTLPQTASVLMHFPSASSTQIASGGRHQDLRIVTVRFSALPVGHCFPAGATPGAGAGGAATVSLPQPPLACCLPSAATMRHSVPGIARTNSRPFAGVRTDRIVASASAVMQSPAVTVELSTPTAGRPVRGSRMCEYFRPATA